MSKWSARVPNEWVVALCSAGTCVAVHIDIEADSASLRDTKQDFLGDSPGRPVISMSLDQWSNFTRRVLDDSVDLAADLQVSKSREGTVSLRSGQNQLTFDAAEWDAFAADVERGRFTLTLI